MAKIKKLQASRKPRLVPKTKVAIYNSQKDLVLSRISVKNLIWKLLDHFKLECGELAVHFIDKKRSAALHHQFFNDPTSTDCMSFPLDDPSEKKNGFLGEIMICPEVALEYAFKNNHDPYLEVSRYVIHSFLHLLGFDDQDPENKRKMLGLENRFLKIVKEQGLVLKK